MRINHKLVQHARIKLAITTRSVTQTDDSHTHDVDNMDAVPHDRLHQLAVLLDHWRLTTVEAMGFGPDQTEANAQAAHFRGGVDGTRIFGDVAAWDKRIS